jgi:NADH dehydrogenase
VDHPEWVRRHLGACGEPWLMAEETSANRRPRVVVLGGGFAGLGAARTLKDADVEVVLVDANDYHSFQPMLYQLATGLLDTTAVAHSLRDLFQHHKNVTIHQATVSSVDLEAREVQFADMPALSYDYLVLGLGAVVQFFGCTGAPENAFPLYTVEDALRLRSHIVDRWETADRDPSLIDEGALNVVVVGGGPTGIESVGALTELFGGDFADDYRAVPAGAARLILVEAGPSLFPMFKEDIREYAQQELEDRGVEIMLGERVEAVEPTRVKLASGTVLPAHTLVWGAGLQASPLAKSLGVDLEKGNRIAVDPELRVPLHPEVFAAGDIAWITDAGTGDVLPQLGSVALQAGEHVGENIKRLVSGKEPKPFEYKDKGTMAAIAPGAAVAQLHGGRTLKGKVAFLAWGAVHLTLLSAWEDRTKAMIGWTWAGFSHERPGRILVGDKEK